MDEEWALVEPLIPPARRGGNRRHVVVREVVNGLMYVLSTGCQWRAIPKDLPPRSTLYDYFDLWSWDGTLDRIHDALYATGRPPRRGEPDRRDHRRGRRDLSALIAGLAASGGSVPWVRAEAEPGTIAGVTRERGRCSTTAPIESCSAAGGFGNRRSWRPADWRRPWQRRRRGACGPP